MDLAKYSIQHYENCHKYLKMVLKDFPLNKITEPIGEAKTPAELLFHAIATPHFWMKRAGRPFEFRAKFETPEEAIDLWERQLDVFRRLLQNENEVFWEEPTSIPWIMVRSCNHLIHHLAMIIYARNYHGLPPLKPLDDGFTWANLVDFTIEFQINVE